MPSVIRELEELLSYSPSAFQEKLRENVHINEPLLEALFDRISSVLSSEPNVLYLHAPITVCGDIHGQMLDLFQLFKVAGEDIANDRYLFMGDYVDRGYSSIETFVYLVFLKLKFPGRVFLLRGNHESRVPNQQYGLYNDCMRLYGHVGIWNHMNEIFDCLPIAAVIDSQIFCVHGGLSPEMGLIEHLIPEERQKDIEGGMIADLTWSDPGEVAKFAPSPRGIGRLFGPEQTRSFLRNNRLGDQGEDKNSVNHGFIARSHQVAQTGYTWMHRDDLVIVWSAPNYSYKAGNEACVMKVFMDRPVEFVKFDKDVNSHIQPVDLEISYFA
jgi:diadenosine tetraphosphatase ApaH/serine/threonine PP2A family protein phosphatase